MKYQDAKKLHNGDQVKIKRTGEVTQVLNTEIYKKEKIVQIYVQSSDEGYTSLHHTEVM